MKWFTLAFVTLAVCAMSLARTIPNGMVFYQSGPMYYKRSLPQPQRMMYVQYMPQHASRRSASAGGVSAFAAGDTIATGTYLRDCVHQTEQEYAEQEKAGVEYQARIPQNPAGNDGAVSVAEAYPEQNFVAHDPLEADEPDFENDPLKVAISQGSQEAELVPESPQPTQPSQETFNFQQTESSLNVNVNINKKKAKELRPHAAAYPEPEPTNAYEPAEDATAFNDADATVDALTEQPARNPLRTPFRVPVAPPAKAYIPPKKKISVELETPESYEYEDEQSYYVPQPRPPKKKAAVVPKKPSPASFPAGTFFPIDFGGASGGAIAIANSFSTGEGGSATSTATAYGSPAVARSKAAKKRLAHH